MEQSSERSDEADKIFHHIAPRCCHASALDGERPLWGAFSPFASSKFRHIDSSCTRVWSVGRRKTAFAFVCLGKERKTSRFLCCCGREKRHSGIFLCYCTLFSAVVVPDVDVFVANSGAGETLGFFMGVGQLHREYFLCQAGYATR